MNRKDLELIAGDSGRAAEERNAARAALDAPEVTEEAAPEGGE